MDSSKVFESRAKIEMKRSTREEIDGENFEEAGRFLSEFIAQDGFTRGGRVSYLFFLQGDSLMAAFF